MDNRRLLKIKLKSLAAEARIIRREEQRTRGELRESLHNHRVVVVRSEARNSHLAYGYIRGRSYQQLERTCRTDPGWQSVARMVEKYGFIKFDNAWFQKEKEEQIRNAGGEAA